MAVLVIADHDNTTLKDNTHKVVTAALAMSGDVDVLVASASSATSHVADAMPRMPRRGRAADATTGTGNCCHLAFESHGIRPPVLSNSRIVWATFDRVRPTCSRG